MAGCGAVSAINLVASWMFLSFSPRSMTAASSGNGSSVSGLRALDIGPAPTGGRRSSGGCFVPFPAGAGLVGPTGVPTAGPRGPVTPGLTGAPRCTGTPAPAPTAPMSGGAAGSAVLPGVGGSFGLAPSGLTGSGFLRTLRNPSAPGAETIPCCSRMPMSFLARDQPIPRLRCSVVIPARFRVWMTSTALGRSGSILDCLTGGVNSGVLGSGGASTGGTGAGSGAAGGSNGKPS